MRPKGSAVKLEARRRLAAKLLGKGKGIREVARQLGAAPSSVKRWKDALLKEGPEGLKPKPHMGRPSRLSGRQRQDLLRVLNKGPQAAKLKSAKWTCAHVGIVIRRLFGVRYHPDHISRILRSIGWRFKKIPPPNNKRSRSFNQPRQWGGS